MSAYDHIMDHFASDTDSDYTSYWRDWVSKRFSLSQQDAIHSMIARSIRAT